MANKKPQDPEVESAIQAIDRWDKIVDSFERFVVVAVVSSKHNTRYRLNLLWLHALSALLMAPLLAATGKAGITGPSFSFLRTMPAAPYSYAILLGVSGTILGIGCVFRQKITEMVGLGGLALFYLMFSVSFAIPAIEWGMQHQGVKPPLYSAIVYAHLTVVMVLHLIGLIIKRREEQQRDLPPDGQPDDS